MKDANGKIIYVGKAKVLLNRVRSYFTGGKDIKTSVLVSKVASIEHIITQNEYEALLLENNLIKQWTPRYNINLKDGKTYPVIRITNEDFPRVFRTRRVIEDGSEYFGPFTNVGNIDTYLELIERLFPLRKCRGPIVEREHPCLYFHIHRCAAPCAGKISREDYNAHVANIRRLLSGDTEALIADLQKRMEIEVAALRFEQAAELRDTIQAIEQLQQRQQVMDSDLDTRDYVAVVAREQLATFCVFQMRSGKLLGSDLYRTEVFGTESEDIAQFITQYYGAHNPPPDKVFLPVRIETDDIVHYFRTELGAESDVATPANARDGSIMAMARENARQDLEKRIRERGNTPALEELAKVLGIPSLPIRIEGFDIAQLNGKHTVAAMVSFKDGVPDKGQYRRFHVKTLDGAIDDFESMREVVARRYTRVVNENLAKPDLILIDGGKGQLGAALGVLQALGLAIPIIGLAKRNEEIYLPGKPDPIVLPRGSAPLRVLQAVRDEAHRFGTTFNQQLRARELGLNTLEAVPGIGEKRSLRLLTRFGSLAAIRDAEATMVAETAHVSEEKARELQARLHEARLHEARTQEAAIKARNNSGADRPSTRSAGPGRKRGRPTEPMDPPRTDNA